MSIFRICSNRLLSANVPMRICLISRASMFSSSFSPSKPKNKRELIRPMSTCGGHVDPANPNDPHSEMPIDRTGREGKNHTILPIEDFLDIHVEEKENETYLEAVPINTGREGLVVEKKSEACALCRLNLRNINYTDVMILSQFIKRDGSKVTYYESKLCRKQYKMICQLISRAQRCNLIPRPADYLVPGPWHDLNTYLEPDRKRDQPMRVIKKQYWKL